MLGEREGWWIKWRKLKLVKGLGLRIVRLRCVQDCLGPRRTESNCFDYTPLHILWAEILCKVEPLGILRSPIKMLSLPEKRNRTKFCQFYHYHGHATKYCNELKKEIESAIKGNNWKNSFDDMAQKCKQGLESTKKPLPPFEEKKFPKPESNFGKLKVINVIQDFSLIASRKQLRKGPRMIYWW